VSLCVFQRRHWLYNYYIIHDYRKLYAKGQIINNYLKKNELKKPKKSTIQNIAFIILISIIYLPSWYFVKVQLNRLLAFSPKTIIVSEQKSFPPINGRLMLLEIVYR
jgi:hypothetical protein